MPNYHGQSIFCGLMTRSEVNNYILAFFDAFNFFFHGHTIIAGFNVIGMERYSKTVESRQKERERDRQTDRQIEKERQTDRERETDRQRKAD
jgi:hypothetical protein